MKEATGELSLVVITIIIIVALIAIWNIAGDYLSNWILNTFEGVTGKVDYDPAT